MEGHPIIVVLDDNLVDRALISEELNTLGFDTLPMDPYDDIFNKLQAVESDHLVIDFNMGLFTALDIVKQKQIYKKFSQIAICSGSGKQLKDMLKCKLDLAKFSFIDKDDLKKGLIEYVSRIYYRGNQCPQISDKGLPRN